MKAPLYLQRPNILIVVSLISLLSGWLLANTGTILSYRANNLKTAPIVKPVSKAVPANKNNSEAGKLIQLSSGLRPGRGDTIPAAQDMRQFPVTDVSFYNTRGFLLSGWLAVQTPDAPVVILAHGTPGNRVSMISRAAFLYRDGYNVLLFDFQSYGKSQGIMSTLGMVESEDILAAIDYLHRNESTENSKIGLLGLSMGATAAVLAAARTADIEAEIAESCPVDATRVLDDVPNEAAREADQQVVQQVYNVNITRARPIDVVNKLAGHTAILFINGDSDDVTPLDGEKLLYSAAGLPKQEWIVAGAGHAGSYDTDMYGYEAHVEDFLHAYLPITTS